MHSRVVLWLSSQFQGVQIADHPRGEHDSEHVEEDEEDQHDPKNGLEAVHDGENHHPQLPVTNSKENTLLVLYP